MLNYKIKSNDGFSSFLLKNYSSRWYSVWSDLLLSDSHISLFLNNYLWPISFKKILSQKKIELFRDHNDIIIHFNTLISKRAFENSIINYHQKIKTIT